MGLGSSILDALRYAGETLDKPGAAVRGLLAGRPDQLLNLVPFSDTLGLTDPSQRTTGRSLLENVGLLDKKSEGDGFGLGDLAGMGVEFATDPVNLFGAAAARRLLGARRAAGETNAARETLLAKGAMPEEVAAATKVRDAAGPVRTYHGTPHVYDAIDPAKFQPDALRGRGYYTTESPALASEYAHEMGQPLRTRADSLAGDVAHYEKVVAARPGDDSARRYLDRLRADLASAPLPRDNVRTQYLDIRKPFDLDAPFPAGAGTTGYDFMRQAGGGDSGQALIRELGYDGLTHLPETGSAGGNALAERVWIALHPGQVYPPWVVPPAVTPPRVSPLLGALAGHNAGRLLPRE